MNEWNPFEEQPKLEIVRVAGVDLRAGDRVRLCPRKTADIMDLALQGKSLSSNPSSRITKNRCIWP